jgi:hypothetical protein
MAVNKSALQDIYDDNTLSIDEKMAKIVEAYTSLEFPVTEVRLFKIFAKSSSVPKVDVEDTLKYALGAGVKTKKYEYGGCRIPPDALKRLLQSSPGLAKYMHLIKAIPPQPMGRPTYAHIRVLNNAISERGVDEVSREIGVYNVTYVYLRDKMVLNSSLVLLKRWFVLQTKAKTSTQVNLNNTAAIAGTPNVVEAAPPSNLIPLDLVREILEVFKVPGGVEAINAATKDPSATFDRAELMLRAVRAIRRAEQLGMDIQAIFSSV